MKLEAAHSMLSASGKEQATILKAPTISVLKPFQTVITVFISILFEGQGKQFANSFQMV